MAFKVIVDNVINDVFFEFNKVDSVISTEIPNLVFGIKGSARKDGIIIFAKDL
jgi:hypothetical protein